MSVPLQTFSETKSVTEIVSDPKTEVKKSGIVNVTNPNLLSSDWRAQRVARKAFQDESQELCRYPEPRVREPKITQSKIHSCLTRSWPALTLASSVAMGGASFVFSEWPYIKYTMLGGALGAAATSCCGTCAIAGEIYRDVSRPTGQRKWIIKHQAKAIELMKQRLQKIHGNRCQYNNLLVSYQKFVEHGGLLWPYRVERFLSEVRSSGSSKTKKTCAITEWGDLSLQRKRLVDLKKQVCDLAQVACYNKEGFNQAVQDWEERQGKEDVENPFEMPQKSAGKWFKIYQMYDNEYRRVVEFFDVALQLRDQFIRRCKLEKEGKQEKSSDYDKTIDELIGEMKDLLDKLKGTFREQVVEEPEIDSGASSEGGDEEIIVDPYEEPSFWKSVGQYVSFALWK